MTLSATPPGSVASALMHHDHLNHHHHTHQLPHHFQQQQHQQQSHHHHHHHHQQLHHPVSSCPLILTPITQPNTFIASHLPPSHLPPTGLTATTPLAYSNSFNTSVAPLHKTSLLPLSILCSSCCDYCVQHLHLLHSQVPLSSSPPPSSHTSPLSTSSCSKLRKVPSMSAIHCLSSSSPHAHHLSRTGKSGPLSASATELSFFPSSSCPPSVTPSPILALDAQLHHLQLPSTVIPDPPIFAIPSRRKTTSGNNSLLSMSIDLPKPQGSLLQNPTPLPSHPTSPVAAVKVESDSDEDVSARRPRMRRRTGEATWLLVGGESDNGVDRTNPQVSLDTESRQALPGSMVAMMKDVDFLDKEAGLMLGIVETKESKDSLPVRHQDMMVDAVDTREPTTVLIKNVEDTSHHLIIESPTVDTASILLPDPPLMPPATRQSFDATAGPLYTPLPAFLDRYILGDILGKGATGFVVTATRRADGLETAVKFILKDRIPPNGWKRDRGLGGVVPVEVFMLRRLEHPNIVRFLELFEDATFFIVVQESVHAFSGSHQTPVASSATTVSSLASTSSTNSLTSAFIERSIIVTPIREAAVAVLKTHREGTTTEDHHDMDHITSPHIDIPSNPIILLRPPPQPFSISSATVSQSPTTPVHTLPLILQLSHSSHHHHHHPLHLRTTSSSPPSSPPPVVARADRRASNPVSARVVAPKRRKGRRPSQDLFECIERNPRMPEGVARVIFAQIVDAVRFMHAKGYVHRDIKDENVIIDDSLRVKLIDFGTARQIPTSSVDYFDDLCGTLAYSAPEVLAGEKYRGPEADVWSLGVLLFILVESTLPFPPDATDPQCRTIRPVLKSRRSAGCVDLVNRMLDPVAERRITMEEVADHEWIKGIGVGEEEGDKRESDSGVEV